MIGILRSRFMLVLGEDPVEWANRWGIKPFTHPCFICKRELTTSVPFAVGRFRGLVAPECECGDKHTPYAIVRDPKHGDLFTDAP